MANVKITQLPLATTPLTGTEVFPLVQGTTTKQVAITGLFTSPVMTNPTLGTVGQADLINATGLPISTGVAGLGTGVATFLGTPSSANLRAAVTDETGTGSLVFANAPVLVAPDLGTPSVLVATNATGTAVGLTAGSAITNANLTGAVTSVGNATSLGSFTSAQLRTALTDETGAGVAVFATSPTITAPILNQINDTNNAQILGLSPTTSAVDYLVVKNGIGVAVPLHFYADGSSANIGLHIQPKGTGLVTISDGTDFNKGIRFRSSSSAASAITLLDAVSTAGRVVTLPDATTTLVGRDTTDTLTNKTIAFSSNTFSGTLAIANGGTGQSTANAALNALLPAQTGNASKYLQTDGTNSSWDAISLSTADITGTLGTANGGTGLTSFTSGGVVYASSTSALATGSALTYDGTTFKLTGSDNNNLIRSQNSNGTASIRIQSNAAGNYLVAAGANPLYIDNGSASGFIVFNPASSTERMRITSAGNVGIGTSSPGQKLEISGGNIRVLGTSTGRITFNNGATEAYLGFNGAGATVLDSGALPLNINVQGANTFAVNTNSSERLRITSAGNVGIGSLVTYEAKLKVATTNGASDFASSGINICGAVEITSGQVLPISFTPIGNDSTRARAAIGCIVGVNWGTGNLGFYTRSAADSSVLSTADEKMRLDSAGNLGLGVTPSAWSGALSKVYQTVGGASFHGHTGANTTYVGQNYYFDGAYKYLATAFATQYQQVDGQHKWWNAPSGTAGNAITFTQAMTLDASGNLLVGVTSGSNKLNVGGYTTSQQIAEIYVSKSGGASTSIGSGAAIQLANSTSSKSVLIQGSDDVLQFWANGGSWNERARIDASGNLLVGTTSTFSSGKVCIQVANGATQNGITIQDNATSGFNYIAFSNGSGSTIASISRVGTTSAVAYNTTSDYRLKTVVGSVTGQGARLDALKPINYLWTESGQQARGFLAHEFQAVYAQSVTGTKDAVDEQGNPIYQAMQAGTAEVIADLVAEIQSLRKRLADAGI